MPTDPSDINSAGLSRKNIISSVENCLERLKTDYLDLLLLNGWDETVSFMETAQNLNDLVRTNKIRYYGVCDFKAWQLQKLVDSSRLN
jgi:1-deoxyxylulose-5-phosphate synthase